MFPYKAERVRTAIAKRAATLEPHSVMVIATDRDNPTATSFELHDGKLWANGDCVHSDKIHFIHAQFTFKSRSGTIYDAIEALGDPDKFVILSVYDIPDTINTDDITPNGTMMVLQGYYKR